MIKTISLKKLLAFSIVTLTLIFGLAPTQAWAVNDRDSTWNYYLTYSDKSTDGREKDNNSASYVLYSAGDLTVLRAAVYSQSTGENVTTEAGYVAYVNRYSSTFVSNAGYDYGRWVELHLTSNSQWSAGQANGKWSPDNTDGII